MSATIHFIDVGQGNMALIQCGNGTNLVVDCNIHDGNESRVLGYVSRQIGQYGGIAAFINTHRDADHMRGVRALHRRFPIGVVWDSGHAGTTTNSAEYEAYMRLRREVGSRVLKRGESATFGSTLAFVLSDDDQRLPNNPNDRGLVLKITDRESAILTGDGSLAVWRDGIQKDYRTSYLSCHILLASHHGSRSFFWDSNDERYTKHIEAMNPVATVISVGKDNPHGHPDAGALRLYQQYATGDSNGRKTYRTDHDGTLQVTMGSPHRYGIQVSRG